MGFHRSEAASSSLDWSLAGFDDGAGPSLSLQWEWLVSPSPSLGKLGPALCVNEQS